MTCVGCGRTVEVVYGEGFGDCCWFSNEQREINQLRAGISWVRGLCSDGEPLEVVDAKLGEVLRGH